MYQSWWVGADNRSTDAFKSGASPEPQFGDLIGMAKLGETFIQGVGRKDYQNCKSQIPTDLTLKRHR